MYTAGYPLMSDPNILMLSKLLADQAEIRMPKDVQKIPLYEDNLVLKVVPRRPGQNCIVDQCWFNCKNYIATNPEAELVFGWKLYLMKNGAGAFGMGAVHHAVIREAAGLVDITPLADANDDPFINYLPDSRVPFDYEKNRSPPAFFYDVSAQPEEYFWTKNLSEPHAFRLEKYSIARPEI